MWFFRLTNAAALGGEAALVTPVLTWVTGAEDNTPTLTIDVPIGAMAENDTWEIEFYSDAGLTVLIDTASGLVNAEDAGDGDISGTLSSALQDGATYARARVVGKTGWSNVESLTIDAPPTMTSATTGEVDENETLSFALTADQPSTFAITGGADSAEFEISGSTLRWVSNGTKDYESPDDADTNNTYVVEVTPTATADSEAGSAQTITISVADVADGGFSPGDFGADLVLWLEASDASTLFQNVAGSSAVSADGQTVGTWNDKSGDNFHLTAAADDGTRPTYNTAGGLHWVTFDGSDDILRRLASTDMYANGSHSLFVAMRGNPGTDRRLVVERNSADNDSFFAMMQSNTGTAADLSLFYRGDSGTVVISNSATTIQAGAFDNTDKVVGVTDSGAAIIPYLNQSAGSTHNYSRSTTFTLDRFALGAALGASAGSFFAGRVYALVLVNRVLTTDEREDLVTYLGAKAGLSI